MVCMLSRKQAFCCCCGIFVASEPNGLCACCAALCSESLAKGKRHCGTVEALMFYVGC